jgi:hypothetical protein
MTVPRVWDPPALSKKTCGWFNAGKRSRTVAVSKELMVGTIGRIQC